VAFWVITTASTPKVAGANREHQTKPVSDISTAVLPGTLNEVIACLTINCAPCHGDDARGDEGPTLYDLAKSDARITAIIKGGIKGEMPSFAKKFSDADVQALIAYLRTLKD